MLIRYIGRKPVKKDNVANTGVVWIGNGDVQEVPDHAVSKLLVYEDIWQRADVGATLGQAVRQTDDPPGAEVRYALRGPEGDVVLDGMDDAALREFARNANLDVDGRIRGDKLRQAIVDAVKAAG